METSAAPEGYRDLGLTSPWMNAAGSLGFRPPREWSWPEPPGAFVTNPVSRHARSPANGRCVLPFPGGFLLHTGLPNPGIRAVLKSNRARWQRSPAPVWVHLLGGSPAEVHEMVRMLEGFEEVAAVEVSLPLTEHEGVGASRLEWVAAAAGELPVIAALPLTDAGQPWLKELAAAGASAICLQSPRGALPADEKQVSGRLYGPALYPLVLPALRQALAAGLPVIAGGGVYTLEDGRALLAAGAAAVQLDAVLWKVGR